MWTHYRKTFVPIQVLILVVCIALLAIVRAPLEAAAMFFVIMQVGSVVGAWWGARFKNRLQTRAQVLPISGR